MIETIRTFSTGSAARIVAGMVSVNHTSEDAIKIWHEIAGAMAKYILEEPITTNQKTKIFALMDEKKIASKEDLTIRDNIHNYNINDAGYLIEKLAKEVYGNELPADMKNYLNSQGDVMKATAERSQRDAT